MPRTSASVSSPWNPIVVDDDYDYSSDATLAGEYASDSDILRSHVHSTARASSRRTDSNLPPRQTRITHPYTLASSCRLRNGQKVCVGETVQLRENISSQNHLPQAELLRVTDIVHNLHFNTFKLRGVRLVRESTLRGAFSSNERMYCALLDIEEDDARPALEQGLEEFDIKLVISKRDLVFTNADQTPAEKLSCKYFVITNYNNAQDSRSKRRAQGAAFKRVSEDEADEGYKVSDECLRLQWRGPSSSSLYDPLTFMDGCAGAGGVSQSAFSAGFKPDCAYDSSADCTATLYANIPYDAIFHAEAHNVPALLGDGPDHKHRCDVCHFSTPCQCYSPANTKQGMAANDEVNQDATFMTGPIILKLRPRVVTLEQTSGLKTHHPVWFHAVINIYTSMGFSIRWKVVNFQHYGLPGRRKRLIMFASCPGGVLPDFPNATHGPPGSGLLPYATVADCIAQIDPNVHTFHNPSTVTKCNLAPYDANMPLRHCFTTGGKNSYHPSGLRYFTVREIAALQGFPLDYKFVEGQTVTSIRRQLGNAVPPSPFMPFMKAVRVALEQQDAVNGYRC